MTAATIRSHGKRVAFVAALLDYLTDMAGGPSPAALRLGVSIEQITALRVLYTAADASLQDYQNLEKKTTAVVRQTKVNVDAMWANFLALRKIVAATITELLEIDRDMFALPIPSPRTPSKKPVDVPIPKVDKVGSRVVYVKGVAQGDESTLRDRLPKYYSLIVEIVIQIAGAGEPVAGSFRLWRVTTKSRETITFDPEDIGKEVWIRMAYRNAAGRGPWSRSIKAIIN